MSALAFVAAARSRVGTRWRHRGRQPWAIDCVGLVVLAARDAGLIIPDELYYGREPWDDMLRRRCREEFGQELQVSVAQPGDVAVVRFGRHEPSHVGIVGDHPHGLSLIHSHNLHGVIEQRIDEHIARMFVCVYRPRWPS